MNWLNMIIVSIGAAISSLFGMSHTATMSIPTSPTPIQQQTTQAPQVSDEQGIINTVTAMLNSERNAVTFQDAENAVTNYASQGVIQQFQTGINKVPATSLSATQSWLLQVDHAYPDPTSLQFTVTINADMATATAALPNTTTTQSNAPGKVIVSTFENSITVPLQKENGQWKVVKIIMASKGGATQIQPPNVNTNALSQAQAKALGTELRMQADMNQLRVGAEMLYQSNQSYAQLCSSGVVNISANATLSQVVQDIISKQDSNSQSGAGLTCLSNANKYVLGLKYNPSFAIPGITSFCIDSTGASGDNTKFTLNQVSMSCEPVK